MSADRCGLGPTVLSLWAPSRPSYRDQKWSVLLLRIVFAGCDDKKYFEFCADLRIRFGMIHTRPKTRKLVEEVTTVKLDFSEGSSTLEVSNEYLTQDSRTLGKKEKGRKKIEFERVHEARCQEACLFEHVW